MQLAHDIGITLGDPSGIGPEIVAATLAAADARLQRRVIVFCDEPLLERAYVTVTGAGLPATVRRVDRGSAAAARVVPGQPCPEGAAAQVAYLEAAVTAARAGRIGALVTAPISKRQARAAGFDFPGHTEFLAERLGGVDVAMMFVGPRLRVVLATVHLALAAVARELTVPRITGAAALAIEAVRRDLGVGSPRVGVVGLNPHAGEGGLFGREELEVIGPAIDELRRRFPEAELSGPLIPDAAFRAAVEGRYDLLVAMYHDQALIPVKLVDFEHAVNVTVGLPIVRTSPDHGVAYDIAGTGVARPASFAAALELAAAMLDRRRGAG